MPSRYFLWKMQRFILNAEMPWRRPISRHRHFAIDGCASSREAQVKLDMIALFICDTATLLCRVLMMVAAMRTPSPAASETPSHSHDKFFGHVKACPLIDGDIEAARSMLIFEASSSELRLCSCLVFTLANIMHLN